VIEAEIDGEVVAMNLETGFCYGLNRIGSRIWQILSDAVSVSSLCTQLCAEYDVEQETCEQQVLSLLEELIAENLVFVIPSK
jgi:hypothetical protein